MLEAVSAREGRDKPIGQGMIAIHGRKVLDLSTIERRLTELILLENYIL